MRVEILYFQSLRRVAGVSSETLDLPEGFRVSDALERVALDRPALAPILGSALLAANETRVSPDAELRDGDRLAIMPPFSGG